MRRMSDTDIGEILHAMGIPAGQKISISQYHAEENGEPYNVYAVHGDCGRYVLKLAKGDEVAVYTRFLSQAPSYAPRLYAQCPSGDGTWLLLEEIQGMSLTHATRPALQLALDSLVAMQRKFWNADTVRDGLSYAACLEHRKKRGTYLEDPLLERVYDRFLEMYQTVPKTLCHDDLLPFNVLVDERRAVMIDWEVADIMAYPTSLARLIAHGTQQPGSLFYLEERDREFAISYYYQSLLRPLGISYPEYRKAIDLAIFYEYCEWIYVGNRYDDKQSTYYRKYSDLTRDYARELLQNYQL